MCLIPEHIVQVRATERDAPCGSALFQDQVAFFFSQHISRIQPQDL